jgi:sterol desaturase/sphingolipid hydroxylase (fatty acid hydroxylase superfamily)
MNIHILPLFIPLLFLLVYLEWMHDIKESRESGKKNFKFQSSITNITFGILERIFDVFFFFAVVAVFNLVKEKIGIFSIEFHHVFAWLTCFVFLDFIIYCFHRSGHTINLLWGAHVTHHQCEEFNLTVAFRNSIFPHIFRAFYMLILPILGFPGEMIIICLAISGLWQFCIHTKHINKLGILEKFMMTPSHHRVHHGKNPMYIDKNFGGFFIIWDRLFGTFQEEIEEVEFGITDEVQHNNALVAMTHVWKDIIKISSGKNSFLARCTLWFQSPSQFYKDNELMLKTTTSQKSKKRNVSKKTIKYQVLHMIIVTLSMMHFLVYVEFYTPLLKVFAILFILVSVVNVSLLYTNNSYVRQIENYRLIVYMLVPILLKSSILFMIGGIVIIVSFRLKWGHTKLSRRVNNTYVKSPKLHRS